MSIVARSRFFFFNDTATTEIYTLSLHDALPIYANAIVAGLHAPDVHLDQLQQLIEVDRKSTRLNSSHQIISYAVFCLKKKKKDYILLICLSHLHNHLDDSVACHRCGEEDPIYSC